MFENLIVYLQAALPHLRESTSTVGREMRLAETWVGILGKAHGGGSISITADEVARDTRIPALILLPLVQHAVTWAAGRGYPARIDVKSRVDDRMLGISVSSTDKAFAQGIATTRPLAEIGERFVRAARGSGGVRCSAHADRQHGHRRAAAQ